MNLSKQNTVANCSLLFEKRINVFFRESQGCPINNKTLSYHWNSVFKFGSRKFAEVAFPPKRAGTAGGFRRSRGAFGTRLGGCAGAIDAALPPAYTSRGDADARILCTPGWMWLRLPLLARYNCQFFRGWAALWVQTRFRVLAFKPASCLKSVESKCWWDKLLYPSFKIGWSIFSTKRVIKHKSRDANWLCGVSIGR